MELDAKPETQILYWNFYVEYRHKNDEKDEDCLRRLKGTTWVENNIKMVAARMNMIKVIIHIKTYDFII